MKPKIAIISLTCCEGCEFAIFDQSEKFLELTKHLDIKKLRLLQEDPPSLKLRRARKKFDLTFIEGSPITKENFETLKQWRVKSKFLIVLGNCASMGGIHQIKNWRDRKKLAEYVYKKQVKTVNNPEIKRIDELVRVDFTIPGCPITGEEFFRTVYDFLAGKLLRIPHRTVCFECQTNEYDCLLQEGKICLGPVTQAGCGAVCLKSKMECWACRGLLPDIKESGQALKNLMKRLKKKHTKDEIDKAMEVFGVRKEVETSLNKK